MRALQSLLGSAALGATFVHCAADELVPVQAAAPVPCIVQEVQAPVVAVAPPAPVVVSRPALGGYQVLSMKYSGPPNIVPLNFRISGAPGGDHFVDAKLGGPDCDIDHLLASTLAEWDRHRGGQPYRLGSMSVGMASNGGGCNHTSNYTGDGELEVSYSRAGDSHPVSRRFVRPCRQGLIYVCVRDLLDAAVEELNSQANNVTPASLPPPGASF